MKFLAEKMVNWTIVSSVVGGLLAISGVLLGWAIFPKAVHEKIIEVRFSLTLKNENKMNYIFLYYINKCLYVMT